MMESTTTAAPPDARTQQAIALVAEAVGELMEFWNFKPSMGRIWAALYLSPVPLDAEEIERRTGLSTGNVSMTLTELLHWGVVRRAPGPSRPRKYEAETDIWAMVGRVFADRELRVVERALARFEEAHRLLDASRSSDAVAMMENRFIATRVHNLLELARTGRKLVERLSRTGTVNMRPIREVLMARKTG